MSSLEKKPDSFDDIIVEADTLLMRVRMLFAEHVAGSIGVIGSDVEKLDISVPIDSEHSVEMIKICRIAVDDEEEYLYLETGEGRRIYFDDLNIYAQQIVVDSLHLAVRVSLSLHPQSASGTVN